MMSKRIASHHAKIITVYSPKKGAGCTTLAVNLACGLMNPDTKVLLIDADIQSSDADVMLYIPGGTTPTDVNRHDLQIEFLQDIAVHHAYGLTDRLILRTTSDHLSRTLEQVSQNYDFIIVDTRSALDEFRMRLFEASSTIVIVTTPTLSSVRAVQKVISQLDKHELTKDKAHLVLNGLQKTHFTNRKADAHQKIKQYLPLPVLAEIPSDERAVQEAAFRNIPLIAYDYHHKRRITRTIMAMIYQLHDEVLQTVSV